MMSTLAIANYRSLRNIVAPLGALKDLGETQIVGQGALDAPAWHWPAR